jgi:hypothetical protein
MNPIATMQPDAPLAPQAGEELGDFEKSIRCFSPRVNAALGTLLEALEYSEDLGWNTWDFAVDLSSLRHLKLSKSELRWLVGKGLIDYAIEVTMPGDADRSFRRPIRPLFCKKTCFVLTSAGAEVARSLAAKSDLGIMAGDRATVFKTKLASVSTGVSPEPIVPKWDRDRQELRVSSIVVKRFKVPAANQEVVLATFEEDRWPARIDDPLPPRGEQSPKRRLQETIKSLNRCQKRSLIRFLGDGSGQGVCWEFYGEFETTRDS